MTEKLSAYAGLVGRFHAWRERMREIFDEWREERGGVSVREWLLGLTKDREREREVSSPQQPYGDLGESGQEYSHILRRKSRSELVRVSAAVMGIEFSYAAETAFVSPTLLKIGVEHQRMTLVWGLSPLVGFFLTPVLGSLSDRCRLRLGRRRPFIIVLAVGVLLGLILVPNGEDLGHAMGDFYPSRDLPLANRTLLATDSAPISDAAYPHPWGVFFTVLGTVLLDFDADACQSPARAYLLDVTVSDDHARGLSTFTIMAGLGGFFGYALGGINWDATAIGEMLGGHVRAVFTLITFIFVICVAYTVTSFEEVPLDVIERGRRPSFRLSHRGHRGKSLDSSIGSYGAMESNSAQEAQIDFNPFHSSLRNSQSMSIAETSLTNGEGNFQGEVAPTESESHPATLKQYLLSIVYMPSSLRRVCLTNLFCWSAHVCYSLYFTDFVGEAVFGGDPKAPDGSESKDLYEAGVRFGCWGMSMYSLSCACYSLVIEKLIRRFRARRVYVGGLLFYSAGMMLMAFTTHPVGVILFSWTAGVMYSTLFTMPYLLVAHYHAQNTFELSPLGEPVESEQVRGLGTDVAIVSSMVFLAQFMLSMCMGTLVSLAGSTVTVVAVASMLAFCGALSATKVMYLDLRFIYRQSKEFLEFHFPVPEINTAVFDNNRD